MCLKQQDLLFSGECVRVHVCNVKEEEEEKQKRAIRWSMFAFCCLFTHFVFDIIMEQKKSIIRDDCL